MYVCMYVCMYLCMLWMDGYRQNCVNVCMYVQTHTCIWNVIPGKMSFNQRIYK